MYAKGMLAKTEKENLNCPEFYENFNKNAGKPPHAQWDKSFSGIIFFIYIYINHHTTQQYIFVC